MRVIGLFVGAAALIMMSDGALAASKHDRCTRGDPIYDAAQTERKFAACDRLIESAKSKKERARAFSGALALRQSANDEATRLFRLAANDCPKSFFEFTAANAELKALGAVP